MHVSESPFVFLGEFFFLKMKHTQIFVKFPRIPKFLFSFCRNGSSDRGRMICQYMQSVWECLECLLVDSPHLRATPSILEAALEALSVSSGESDIPVMKCLQLIMPQVISVVFF